MGLGSLIGTVGGAILGGPAGAAIGGSIGGAIDGKDAADDAAKANEKAQQASLDFQKQRYADWKNVYGDIQDNLGTFYRNLTPDKIIANGLQEYEKTFRQAKTQVHQNLAQRGLSNSGVALELDAKMAIDRAEERAEIRSEAPYKLAQEKRSFLQIGLGQNPASEVGQVLRDQANNSQRVYEAAAGAAGEAMQNVTSSIGTVLTDSGYTGLFKE